MSTPKTKISEYMIPSWELGQVLGHKYQGYHVLKSLAIKRVWGYAKEQGLIDPINPRVINTDVSLKGLHDHPVISMYELPEIVDNHLTKRRVPYNSDS